MPALVSCSSAAVKLYQRLSLWYMKVAEVAGWITSLASARSSVASPRRSYLSAHSFNACLDRTEIATGAAAQYSSNSTGTR